MGPTLATIPLLYVVFLLFPTFSRKCSTIPTFLFLNFIYNIQIQLLFFYLAPFARSDLRKNLLYCSRKQTVKTPQFLIFN